MNLKEIVKNARADNQSAFGKVNDKRAAKILQAAFRQVNSQLNAAKDGNVAIGGLGRFAIKSVEREKGGVKVTKRRVTFRQRGAGMKGKAKSDQS
jgi:nucleoid DNA-binding protein